MTVLRRENVGNGGKRGRDVGRGDPTLTSGGLFDAVAHAIAARPTVPRLALSPEEAAHALGVSRDYFDEHIGPELRWVRRGRRKFVALRELERWLEEARVTL